MSPDHHIDPAMEQPIGGRAVRRQPDVAARGSLWFFTGVLAVLLVFGSLWMGGVVPASLLQGDVKAISPQIADSTIDTSSRTGSTSLLDKQ
ncbi:hypothetical protein [Notoacmeibacter ruber]|uniref:Uncharacterized protein n=1 Tax=Notoacmeibacter ruber TaxID=2670375 RepID=A0A3L7JC12_9HYPH|nr:hypothetical protein [Notoacmeibacter ruber]RLQ88288.1 hypothetical protein D8780_08785 [Notoacmeibacter ruber]